MTKLTKSERESFEAIGAAICGSKDAAKTKKAKMPLVAGEEQTAIRIEEPA